MLNVAPGKSQDADQVACQHIDPDTSVPNRAEHPTADLRLFLQRAQVGWVIKTHRAAYLSSSLLVKRGLFPGFRGALLFRSAHALPATRWENAWEYNQRRAFRDAGLQIAYTQLYDDLAKRGVMRRVSK